MFYSLTLKVYCTDEVYFLDKMDKRTTQNSKEKICVKFLLDGLWTWMRSPGHEWNKMKGIHSCRNFSAYYAVKGRTHVRRVLTRIFERFDTSKSGNSVTITNTWDSAVKKQNKPNKPQNLKVNWNSKFLYP